MTAPDGDLSMRLLGLPLVLLTLAAGPGPRPASAQTDARTETQEALIELAIGGISRRTVLALETAGDLLLPAEEFFDLIELRVTIDSAGRLSGIRHPERSPIFLDPLTGRAAAGDSSWTIERTQVSFHGEALHIGTRTLARLLDLRFHLDWTELRLTLMNPQDLPVARRIARERARRSRTGVRGPRPDRVLGLHRPSWDGAVFDWTVLYPGGGSLTDRTSYRAGVGTNLLGGSLELSHQDFGTLGDRTTASWLGVWPDGAILRQLGLGDVLGTGPRPSGVRGVFLSNSPYVRPAFFDRDVLTGQLPPGWEVELYRDGRLIDFAEVGDETRFRLQAPLDYGPNPLELRAYGPYGQVRIWEQAVRVQPDRLPSGIFEYGLAAGECRDRPCELTANLDLAYGASRAVTVRLGADAFLRDTMPDLFQPYASMIGTVASRWVVRAEALWDGFAGGDLVYEPSPDLRIGAGAAWFDSGVRQPVLTPDGRRGEYRAFGFWRPLPALRTFFLEATALRVRNRTSTLTLARLGGSYQTGPVRWSGGLRTERSEASGVASALTIVDLSVFTNLRSQRIEALDGLFLRAGLETSRRGFERLEWVASRPLLGETRLDLRVSWVRGNRDPFVALGVTATLPGARSVSQLAHAPQDGVYATSFAEGSVIWNGPTRSVDVAPGRSLGRGGIGGLVFLDANGNGRYDGDDEALEGVRLQVGPNKVISDEHGRYGIWDLIPFVEQTVAIDSMSLSHPLWVPAFSLATVTVGPNRYRYLEVPVLPSAEVVGEVSLRTSAGRRALSGLRLELLDLDSGRTWEIVTFYDGEFYLLGLPPGRYQVRVPSESRATLGSHELHGDVRFEVHLENGAAVAPLLHIEIQPRD